MQSIFKIFSLYLTIYNGTRRLIMGKKRRMKANPAKYGKKYANHPIIRAWAAKQSDVSDAAAAEEPVQAEVAEEVVAEDTPTPKKNVTAPVRKAAEKKAPLRSAPKKTTKKS